MYGSMAGPKARILVQDMLECTYYRGFFCSDEVLGSLSHSDKVCVLQDIIGFMDDGTLRLLQAKRLVCMESRSH